MSATIVGIYTTSTPGTPLHSVPEGRLEAGKGLVGDRYYRGVGTFSERLKGSPDSEITLIESEEIEHFNQTDRASAAAGEFRRNIVTSGVRLNDLVGRRFTVGAAELEGLRLCEPCAHLAKLVRPSVLRGMAHKAGLRARIVTGAIIRPGDRIEVRER